VRGKTRINKMRGGVLRSKLFVCSFSAKRSNATCKALYERLVAKGKNGKLALIAVCNKLLKQALPLSNLRFLTKLILPNSLLKARLFNTVHVSSRTHLEIMLILCLLFLVLE
jgi:hypothetical protein